MTISSQPGNANRTPPKESEPNRGVKGSTNPGQVPDAGVIAPPTISLPKGGGAIRGIGEKFSANPVTGTGSMSVPIAISPGRSGFGPQLNLTYDSGSGNGPFGFGWSLSIPSITRKTDKGLPRYQDAEASDVFLLSGAEDLVPVFKKDQQGNWLRDSQGNYDIDEITSNDYLVRRFRPRVEGLFALIERWSNKTEPSDVYWRTISKDNILTLYGRDSNSQIYDPTNPDHIFSWLICESRDDKGNAILYEYKEENSENINLGQAHERNRTETSRSANRSLKRIRYGNRLTLLDSQGQRPLILSDAALQAAEWLFEAVFDYGEGYYSEGIPNNQGRIFATAQITPPVNSHWLVRQDPFSSYRAGFEVRIYRLCRRMLMFHHFPQELGINDCLVRSTKFNYNESHVASFISSVTQSGYLRQPELNYPIRYLKKSLPPVEFTYSSVPSASELAELPIRDVDAGSMENLPNGLDGTRYQWVDLDGEGISGILSEQGGDWYYKRNFSANNLLPEGGPVLDGRNKQFVAARFGAIERVTSRPSLANLNGGRQQLLDLNGNGQIDLVTFSGNTPGFFERTQSEGWESFKIFHQLPNIQWDDPNLRFMDLDGDGHADVLIMEGEVFTWYPSLAEQGFDSAERVFQPHDEEKGPRLVFADGTQSIFLADMSGDGLTDLLRIRNGEVCYWPN